MTTCLGCLAERHYGTAGAGDFRDRHEARICRRRPRLQIIIEGKVPQDEARLVGPDGSVLVTIVNVGAPKTTVRAVDLIGLRVEDEDGSDGYDIEYHRPACPKILSEGKKACRCGAVPLEALFEDELAKVWPLRDAASPEEDG